ncbi:hypothetical protein T11_12885 [Trichinella zimbabwensis]|uniref:PiggyBac transposable element-derived protein domain-containing protein n=1 Tax=Trichinella zimbabwensis TaxID=268475 RepID=A0A0V1HXU0_9BILA|nr:hypothetical protein T11_12885 [Trichinella zimbabwensis]
MVPLSVAMLIPLEQQADVEICWLPYNEDGNITDEEHIDEDLLDKVIPRDVCGEADTYVRHENAVNNLVIRTGIPNRLTHTSPQLVSMLPIALLHLFFPKDNLSISLE